MKRYLKKALQTPQNQPLPGAKQVPNSAGGYAWGVGPWEQLRRFLILGSEGGSYYASEQKLTLDNAHNVLACIRDDGPRVVAEIVAISEGGRAPKNDPAIFGLALAASQGDVATRREALEALPRVCRTGTHLFSFVALISEQRGWGRALRRAVANWYREREARQLAYQVVKYRQRDGWTHRDVLRLSHAVPPTPAHDGVFNWVTHRHEKTTPDKLAWKDALQSPDDDALSFLWAFEQVQRVQHVRSVIQLIETYDLPREALPTAWLRDPAIWEALLNEMPMMAMLRNLGNMTRAGLLTKRSQAVTTIVERLRDGERLRKARVHPIAVLNALRVYAGGRQLRGRLQPARWNGNAYELTPPDWEPVPRILDALNDAFELAFQAIEPTRQRWMLALDVSGSMGIGTVAGVPGLTPREASAAMAMVTARTEPDYQMMAFSDKLVPMDISASMRLDKVVDEVQSIPMGRTDCAQPMLHALKHRIPVDTFVVYTDSETWFGSVHPAVALRDYRQKMGLPARLIVVGMVSNGFTIADPLDAGMLDVVGFDAAAPAVMADFSQGNV